MARRNRLEAVKTNTPEEVPAEDKNPLDDPAKQEAILHPGAKEVTIGGEAVQLYPLPAEKLRPFRFFAKDILTGSWDVESGTRAYRVGEQLAQRMEHFCGYIAASEVKPPEPRNAFAISTRASAIAQAITDEELVLAYSAICELNKSLETPNSPN